MDCIACNGSGHYDNTGSPKCSSCGGTGKKKGTRDISHISDKELNEELARRKKEAAIAEAARSKAAAELLHAHVDALLAVVPKHSRTSCSDENPSNTDRDCVRCQLLDIQSSGCSDYEISLLSLKRITE